MKAVSYASIASVLRQCDQSHQKGCRADSITNDSMLFLHAAMTTAKNPKKKLTPSELANVKLKIKCRFTGCGKFGNWVSDHNTDGTLKPGVVSNDYGPANDNEEKKCVLTFSMVHLQNKGFDTPASTTCGPVLDDAAPYSALGLSELKFLQPVILPRWKKKLTPFRKSYARPHT